MGALQRVLAVAGNGGHPALLRPHACCGGVMITPHTTHNPTQATTAGWGWGCSARARPTFGSWAAWCVHPGMQAQRCTCKHTYTRTHTRTQPTLPEHAARHVAAQDGVLPCLCLWVLGRRERVRGPVEGQQGVARADAGVRAGVGVGDLEGAGLLVPHHAGGPARAWGGGRACGVSAQRMRACGYGGGGDRVQRVCLPHACMCLHTHWALWACISTFSLHVCLASTRLHVRLHIHVYAPLVVCAC